MLYVLQIKRSLLQCHNYVKNLLLFQNIFINLLRIIEKLMGIEYLNPFVRFNFISILIFSFQLYCIFFHFIHELHWNLNKSSFICLEFLALPSYVPQHQNQALSLFLKLACVLKYLHQLLLLLQLLLLQFQVL